MKKCIKICNMEKAEKTNFLDTKFSLDNLKKQKKFILENRITFIGFDRLGSSKDVMIKEYYDTPDFFLHDRGITVNKNTIKGKKTSELVVRFDTGRERIKFLSNIPDTFSIQIGRKDSIYKYADFIASSISELVPNGISVDLMQLAHSIYRVCTVTKQREVHRFINITGLKLDISFAKVKLESNISRAKDDLLMMEITCLDADKSEDYQAFVKKISFNNPTLIKLKNSDIEIAKNTIFKK